MDIRRFTFGLLAYVVPTFALGYVWHLVLFASYYDELRIYRPDIIIPFGFASMVIQGAIFSVVYQRLFAAMPVLRGSITFGVMAAVLAWTFTTLAVAAKHPMTSVSAFMLIETGFTIVQFALVSPLMTLAWSRGALGAAPDRQVRTDAVR